MKNVCLVFEKIDLLQQPKQLLQFSNIYKMSCTNSHRHTHQKLPPRKINKQQELEQSYLAIGDHRASNEDHRVS